jgi:AraC family transcriptional activator of pobA
MVPGASALQDSARKRKPGHIPLNPRYGADADTSHPEFLHIEDLRGRSARHGLDIPPHAHPGLFQIMMVTEGGVRFTLDDDDAEAPAPGVVTVPPSVVHGVKLQPGTDGYILTLAEGLLSGQMGPPGREILADFLARPIVIDLLDMPEQKDRVLGVMRQIALEYGWGLPNRALMLQWLVSALLLVLHRYLPSGVGVLAASEPKARLHAPFRELVEREYRAQRPVAWYADQLGVTVGRLNRSCQTLTGRSAFEIITDRVVLEARRLLTYTVLPVTTISYDLGFNDAAYFYRFFQRQVGVSPGEFRRSLRNGSAAAPRPADGAAG